MIQKYIQHFLESIENKSFLKLKINLKNHPDTLEYIIIKSVIIKGKSALSFLYRYANKDITKNYDIKQSKVILQDMISQPFCTQAILFDKHYDIKLHQSSDNEYLLTKLKPSAPLVGTSHDKVKQTNIPLDAPFLHLLGLTTTKGLLHSHAQDKYRQIEHYIKILSPYLKQVVDAGTPIRIVDMGSGKGYLTFALYHYIRTLCDESLVSIMGIEYRADLVSRCNDIALSCGYTHLTFTRGAIADADIQGANVVIALHACDTATDDALLQGIRVSAALIIVAPCCQKQVRQSIDIQQADLGMQPILRHGIMLERQASIATDIIRAEILNHEHYKTKVVEFISDAHTPKNVMIIATKTLKPIEHIQQHYRNIQSIKKTYGISKHYLEEKLYNQ